MTFLSLYRDLMKLILDKGHSRVPVYYEQPINIIGLILVIFYLCYLHSKSWIGCDGYGNCPFFFSSALANIFLASITVLNLDALQRVKVHCSPFLFSTFTP